MAKQLEGGIAWTDATWNPIRGCSRVSEGCRNCYAEAVAYRFSGPGQPYEGLVRVGADGKRKRQWNGTVRLVEKHLLDPLKWKSVFATCDMCGAGLNDTCMHGSKVSPTGRTRRRRIFVNSMSDLFHENVTDEMRDRIFAVMALCPQHTFQILTKRPERMLAYLKQVEAERDMQRWLNAAAEFQIEGVWDTEGFEWPLPNVQLGVSVENQAAADERIPLLLQTPAAVRFISAEPLLGPLEISGWLRPSFAINTRGKMGAAAYKQAGGSLLDWVICGGESGPGARPMHPDWARSLRDQCVSAGVPFFFKQWGEWTKKLDRDVEDPDWNGDYTGVNRNASLRTLNLAGGCGFHGERVHVMERVGKHAAGSLLDGVSWKQFSAVKG